ncbi:DUF6966 domain-containing protein [Leifsonia kafniensis]|uniref:DUF6966 domain-containing protein n=1 Tax=Leifsonia kafniensis TaxID=475957 RepID=UPI0031F0298D
MDESAARPDPDRLIELLNELGVLLAMYGESHWSKRLTYQSDRVNAFRLNAYAGVKSEFGGMGSLNDLLIMKANGHQLEVADERSANDWVSSLSSKIYDELKLMDRSA